LEIEASGYLLEPAVCEEPPDAAMLENRGLLDPEIADESFSARVNALNEICREERHLGPKREDEWEWLLEFE
jgi:hypothetical protein